MRVLKLYAASATTTNAAAQVQFPRRGRIKGVLFTNGMTAGADGTTIVGELSFSSTGQQTTNDTIGPIAGFEHRQRWIAGLNTAMVSMNVYIPMDVPVNAFDRVYLNLLISGTVTAEITQVFIYLAE